MSDEKSGVVIVGGGHAGAMTAITLRQLGYGKDIEIIGIEPYAPYQRPPLSKEWLCSKASWAALEIRPLEFYEKKRIRLRLGAEVRSIDPIGKLVTLHDQTEVRYENLVCALGASPVVLSRSDSKLEGVLTLRDLSDAQRMKHELERARRLVVIGGGFIGLEVAASARQLGLDVTLVEKAERVLARVASPRISAYVQEKHSAQGVRTICGLGVAKYNNVAGRVSGVVLDNGEELDCDCIVVGIGATPNDSIAKLAGVECNHGIVVDAECRTSVPHIYGVGDCATASDDVYDPTRLRFGSRFESIAAANDQARRAAASICGMPAATPEVPWFWSDQYDVKFQMAGSASNADHSVVRGDAASGAFAIFHLKNEIVTSVEAVNNAGSFVLGKSLIAKRVRVDPIRLADTNSTFASVVVTGECVQ
ncbi:ferredoxin reductase [Cupriavidus sp. TA19]|nr:ferredoxin reductase [Cupriavidus sp. TA19]